MKCAGDVDLDEALNEVSFLQAAEVLIDRNPGLPTAASRCVAHIVGLLQEPPIVERAEPCSRAQLPRSVIRGRKLSAKSIESIGTGRQRNARRDLKRGCQQLKLRLKSKVEPVARVELQADRRRYK